MSVGGWGERSSLSARNLFGHLPIGPRRWTAALDSSLDDEISTIANLNNEFFYTHLFEDWSDSKSGDDSDLMVRVASIIHKENEVYMPQCRVITQMMVSTWSGLFL
jgi:hypothetical protein